jgi:hypothetical protein
VECDENIAHVVKKESEDSIVWAGNYFKIPCPHLGQGKIGTDWYKIH